MNDEKINESIKEIKEKFYEIKKKPFHKSLRKGYGGLGYTFETLIGKDEDTSYEPDYKGIELKTKLGYSKNSLTLFNLASHKIDEKSVYKYLIDNFGHYKDKNKKVFVNEIYANKLIEIKYGIFWKLKILEDENKVKVLIINNSFKIIDDSIYWNLSDIKERLITKLKYMALIKGYPYKYNSELYYKYTNLNFYKLNGFSNYLELLKNGNIFIGINLGYEIINNTLRLTNRHFSFKMNMNSIDSLFEEIY